jgi:hypothetical protein
MTQLPATAAAAAAAVLPQNSITKAQNIHPPTLLEANTTLSGACVHTTFWQPYLLLGTDATWRPSAALDEHRYTKDCSCQQALLSSVCSIALYTNGIE